jgi:crossover junction endodeoxyribonuclease RuvC
MKPSELFVGIDPGFFGAVAVLTSEKKLVKIVDTPITEVKKGKKHQHVYLPRTMAQVLIDIANEGTVGMVGLELVGAMPGQGTHSMFVMGEGVGIWRGIIAALGLPLERVTPQAWKKEMLGKGSGFDKSASIVRAQMLFPQAAPMLTRKKDDGRAEALLLAEFVRRRFQGA